MSQYDNTDRTAYMALGMIFGAAAGVVAGMLTAPRSGAETRMKVRDRAMTARDQAMEQFSAKRDVAADKLSKTLEKSKGAVDKAADKAKDAADKTSARAKRASDKAQAEAETDVRPPGTRPPAPPVS